MTINYDSAPSDDLDFDCEDSSDIFDNSVAEFELHTGPLEGKKSKHYNKRSFLAKKKIEQLQEARYLRKLDDDYYDDWD